MPFHALTVDLDALKITVICSTVLLVKCIACNMAIGKARISSGSRPPEDAMLFKGIGHGVQDFVGALKKFDSVEHEAVCRERELRAVRSAMNDLENIPISLLINSLALLAPASVPAHIGFTVGFAANRVMYSVCYACKLQPYRSAFWFGAIGCMIGFTANGVIGVLRL